MNRIIIPIITALLSLSSPITFSQPLLPGTAPICTSQVCNVKVNMTHQSLTGEVQVPVYFWYPSSQSNFRPTLKMAVLCTGALVRAMDYSQYAEHLAGKHNFLVAIPEYASRALPLPESTKNHIAETIAKGYNCSPNGIFSSAKLLDSLETFITTSGTKHLPDHVILIGHSWGGVVAPAAMLGSCDIYGYVQAMICEGFRNGVTSALGKVRGVIIFEGRIEPIAFQKIRGFPIMQVYSPFLFMERLAAANRFNTKYSQHLLNVKMKNGTNHFMINNFTPQTKGAKTICAVDQRPPATTFTTTSEAQSRVVKDCADLTAAALDGFQSRNDVRLLKQIRTIASVDVAYFSS